MMKIIKRTLFNKVVSLLNSEEILIIAGPRQCGKTTLMKFIQDYLKKNNEKTIYFNLDWEEDKRYFRNQKAFADKLELEFGDNKAFVFIDEIQRKENAGIFLKGIYDSHLPYKLIASVSGSLELKEKIHESLAGRKIVFDMTPVNFEEFVNFKTQYAYENNLKGFFEIEREQAKGFLDEYLSFGGYPKCVISETENEKKLQIDEIYKSYIEKDISYWLKVDKIYAFRDLIKFLSFYTGKIINYSEISSALNISLPTLKNYIYYAEKTFVINEIKPYFKNPLKELVKSPSVYFTDIGLKNYISGKYGFISEDYNRGFLFQNFIFNILNQKTAFTPYIVKFWRSKDKAEVDFIIDKNFEVVPIEVKYANFKKPKIPSSLNSFIKRYKPPKAYIVNLGFDEIREINGTKVIFMPYYRFLFEKI